MTDRVYLWRDLRFTLPAGFDDETVLTFARTNGGAVSLTVTRDALPGSVEAYAKAQEQAFSAQKPPGYVVDGPHKDKDSGAVVVDRRFDDEESGAFVQRQAFKSFEKGSVVVVTATARVENADKARRAVVDVVQSLALGDS